MLVERGDRTIGIISGAYAGASETEGQDLRSPHHRQRTPGLTGSSNAFASAETDVVRAQDVPLGGDRGGAENGGLQRADTSGP